MVGAEIQVFTVGGVDVEEMLYRYQYGAIRVPPGTWTLDVGWFDAQLVFEDGRRHIKTRKSKSPSRITFEAQALRGQYMAETAPMIGRVLQAQ